MIYLGLNISYKSIMKLRNIFVFFIAAIFLSFTVTGVCADTATATTATTISFSDVDASTAEGAAIYKLANAGIVNGHGDGTFAPKSGITRAELCKMVNLIYKYTQPDTVQFSDVTQNDWFANHVLIAKKAGYIKGYDDGTFRGQKNITRQEFCAIICRVNSFYDLSAMGIAVNITDTVDEWALKDVKTVISNNIMKLEEGGKFRATEAITRGEVASVLANFVQTATTTPSISGSIGGGSTGGSGSSSSGSSGGSSSGGSGSGSSGSSGGSSSGSSGNDSTGSGSTGGSIGDNTGSGDTTGGSTGDNAGNGDTTGGSAGDNTGSGDSTGGSTGDNTGSGDSTGGSTGGDTDDRTEEEQPEVDYTEQNEEVVAQLTTAKTELKNNRSLFTKPQREIIDIMINVLDSVINDKAEYLISTETVYDKYADEIVEALDKYGEFDENGRSSFVSKISQLNSEVFNFLEDFFGLDFSDVEEELQS